MVLRDAAGLVVDSLNYGGLVDPWAAEGYQAISGPGQSGCFVTVLGPAGGLGPIGPAAVSNASAGRYPDGHDTGSNCADFLRARPTLPLLPPPARQYQGCWRRWLQRRTNHPDRSGANLETAEIATVGTPGATTIGTAIAAGATQIPLAGMAFFGPGQTVSIGSGADHEIAVTPPSTGSAHRSPSPRPSPSPTLPARTFPDRHHPHRSIDSGTCRSRPRSLATSPPPARPTTTPSDQTKALCKKTIGGIRLPGCRRMHFGPPLPFDPVRLAAPS